ncbi:DUF6879 family protein [Streptomyces sp. NPDC021020]|uniref:DUF6879 family protein n=1 Tax=Streptomyces sp. NPDC021020 TaxID=3365109 RepID=UPI0037A1044D
MSSSSMPSFEQVLDGTRHSAVHLEMRDAYGVGSDVQSYARWQAAGELNVDPESDYWRQWVELIRRTVARGVVVRRARIVSEPVSAYIRYEHALTVVNVEAGEQVRWLPRRRASDIALPGNDFWLFDGRTVRWNHFTGEGGSAPREMTEDPAAARLCGDAFEAVWSRAIPHDAYVII